MTEAVIFVVFPLCLAIAAFCDLLTMTIPNRVPAILLAAFLLAAPLAGIALPAIGLHLLAGLAVFSACFALFAFNVMGGGDAKLLTASAVWFGFSPSLIAFLLDVSMAGGALTLVVLILRNQENVFIGIPLPSVLFTQKKVPYGVAIAIGGFLAYPASPLMQAVLTRF